MIELPLWFYATALLCIGFTLGIAVAHAGYRVARADAADQLRRQLDGAMEAAVEVERGRRMDEQEHSTKVAQIRRHWQGN